MTAALLMPSLRVQNLKPIAFTIPKPRVTYADLQAAYQRSRRMQPVYYLVAVLGISAIGAASVVALEVLRPEGYNSQAAYTILGFLTPTVVALVAILKSAGNGQTLDHLHKCMEQRTEAIHEAATVAATEAQKAKLLTAQTNLKVTEALTESGKRRADEVIDGIHEINVQKMTVEKMEKPKE